MSKKNYTKNISDIPWDNYCISGPHVASSEALLSEKASLIGHVGMIMLSCGTTAWRVRSAMNKVARVLGVTCVAEIGLISINYTCFSAHESYTQTFSLDSIGVNTDKLTGIERYVADFAEQNAAYSIEENHRRLNEINSTPHLYPAGVLVLAAAMACASFMFNLGGGLAEIICVFIAAGCGNLARILCNRSKLSAMIGVVAASVSACVVYAIAMTIARALVPGITSFGTGYIGSVLFLVPGFPFITSILDFGKLDMRSGIERLVYSMIVMAFATTFCWIAAVTFGLDPGVGEGLVLDPVLRTGLRLVASFCGVIGFSIIFNSPMKMAITAGLIGCIANTMRLTLVDYAGMSAVVCSFLGAFLVGILATLFVRKANYPRVGFTVPAVVVSVPGLFMYRAIYYLGTGEISTGLSFMFKAIAIVFAIGLGILFSRYCTDSQFRHRG